MPALGSPSSADSFSSSGSTVARCSAKPTADAVAQVRGGGGCRLHRHVGAPGRAGAPVPCPFARRARWPTDSAGHSASTLCSVCRDRPHGVDAAVHPRQRRGGHRRACPTRWWRRSRNRALRHRHGSDHHAGAGGSNKLVVKVFEPEEDLRGLEVTFVPPAERQGRRHHPGDPAQRPGHGVHGRERHDQLRRRREPGRSR